ncbi:uncharacterized protein IL334_004536 [Kwoniella shivajii]|uniref:Zn(2)-C6 fungal-type domain-containing protein n=1 Tax=Kwoniella shivajii TaxID=564305 RepID=A0ABZ1D2I5_9TREE|nr:hypothetical protein IL334_004536 [Kwoniella shivajii]
MQAETPLHPIRISQRPAKSCTECIRRKTRCNKQIPCDVCTRRGVRESCRLESQYIVPSPEPRHDHPVSEIEALRQSLHHELNTLRKRITELEKTVGQKGDSISQSAEPDGPEDAATTLEFFALGLDRRLGGEETISTQQTSLIAVVNRHILTEPGRIPPDSVTDSLLPQHIVNSILNFHQHNVYWQHACVYFPHFWEEVHVFYDVINREGWARLDGAWVALFYVLQAIAVHQMVDEEAVACGLNEADRYVLPTALISSSMAALHHASFLSSPSMFTCQAIAILTLCGHNVCDSDLLSSLLAIGIKMAQSLNLHSLGRVRDKTPIDWQIGKRVWWSLTMEDWFAIPFRGLWSVHPDHFNTPIPHNCTDEDLANGHIVSHPDSQPTVAFKSRFSSQTASILQKTFHRLRHSPNPSSALSLVNESAGHILRLISQLPKLSSSTPSWTSNMLHYLVISASHKILVIYRAFLARGGSASERAIAQKECIKAAQSIIGEMDTRSGSQALWTIPYHTLAAGVVLALDLIENKGNHEIVNKRKGEVEKARRALQRLAPTSRVARRGLQVLEDLIKEGDKKRKRGEAGMAKMVKKIRLPEDVLLESAPPSTAHTPQSEMVTPTSTQFQPTAIDLTSPFTWSQEDMNGLLASLQETVPDVGRLFDGSLGSYGFDFLGAPS